MARAVIIGKMIATALLESFLRLSLCSCISSFLFDHDGKSKNNQAFTDINESTRRDPQDLVVRYLDIVKFSPRCSQCCSYIPVEPAIGITGSALLNFTYITKNACLHNLGYRALSVSRFPGYTTFGGRNYVYWKEIQYKPFLPVTRSLFSFFLTFRCACSTSFTNKWTHFVSLTQNLSVGYTS